MATALEETDEWTNMPFCESGLLFRCRLAFKSYSYLLSRYPRSTDKTNPTVCWTLLPDQSRTGLLLPSLHMWTWILRGNVPFDRWITRGQGLNEEERKKRPSPALITKQSGILRLQRNPRLKGGDLKVSEAHSLKTAEEARLQRKCVKCAKLVPWTCFSHDYRELFGFVLGIWSWRLPGTQTATTKRLLGSARSLFPACYMLSE